MKKRGSSLFFYEKKGQFYLTAAVVIAVMIMGLIIVANQILKKPTVNIEHLREEIILESSKTMDYILKNGFDFHVHMNYFEGNYSEYFQGQKSHYFIFGNQSELTVVGYNKNGDAIQINGDPEQTSNRGDFKEIVTPQNNEKITLHVGEDEHSFEIREGKNFYFVIYYEPTTREKYIISG